ncbi:MAG: hypothetical protein AAF696_09585 [Bacteroidota bacterium]
MRVFFSTILCLFSYSILQATTFHVNNQTGTSDGANGIYAEIQDAHDVALDGDTIIVDGTPNLYQSPNISKRLVIMGPGYFQNENPNTNTFPASIRTINLRQATRGDVNSGAAGSVVQGFDFGEQFSGGIDIDVNNTIVRKNRIKFVNIQWSTVADDQVRNTIISQNYFVDNGNNSHIQNSFRGIIQDAIIRNNIFEGIITIPEFSKLDFLNNVVINPQFSIENINGVVRNNVFLSNSPTYALSADSVTHNISLGAGLPSGNGNITNAQSGNIFVLSPINNGTDGQYRLNTNSLALGSGYQGTDIGPFGGTSPYIVYGIGEMPVIWFLNVSSPIDPGQNLPILIRAVSGS